MKPSSNRAAHGTQRLHITLIAVFTAALVLVWTASTHAVLLRCPAASVKVGPVCVDKYEASVWRLPDDPLRVGRVQRGHVKLDELTAAGATQVGEIPHDSCTRTEYGETFPVTGNWTEPLYAISVGNVLPSTCITWFQAEQACRL